MSGAGAARIGLLGCEGRMGKRVLALLASEFVGRAELVAAVDRRHSPEPLLACDVVIDFASAEAACALAARITADKKGPGLVVASTGWQTEQRELLGQAAQHVPILMSANFSLGVLALMEILKTAAPLLDSLGYKPVLIEAHHEHKKDAPSGTALALQKLIEAEGRRVETHSIRAGELVGDHEVTFYGPSDLLRIGHSARDRDIFARGAIEAALWLAARRSRDPSGHGMLPVENFFSDLKRAKGSV